MAFLTLHSRESKPAHRSVPGQMKDPGQTLEALLARMRQHLYPENLPVLASCWLKTLCSAGHNQVWWGDLNRALRKLLRQKDLDPLYREVLLSVQSWVQTNVLSVDKTPAGRKPLEPPCRHLAPERLIPYVSRMFNDWLPTEVAYLLATEDEFGIPENGGIPGLAVAKALDRLLVRERLSLETMEMLIAPGLLSPALVYPSDAEILRDVVLAHLGRIYAAAPDVTPAALLGTVAGSALPADYQTAVRSAWLDYSRGREELHVPITAANALEILSTDPVRIGSLIVTMDGRLWQSSALHSGEQNIVAYTPAERLRIDFSDDHARLTVPWPEAPSQWSGVISFPGPFEIFGREWRTSSWEIRRDTILLHLAFSRFLPVSETLEPAACGPRLRPAYVDMAWSEVEHALSESLLANNMEPVEQMRRAELIPLGRALYGLAESVRNRWLANGKQIETHLRAVRYHEAAAAEVYGRPPWRILPSATQANLTKMRLNPASSELVIELFDEAPKAFSEMARRGHPSQAA